MVKRFVLGIAVVLAASLLLSQSLADLSKQETERREKLKGKTVRVITNADLRSKTKTAALQVTPPPAADATEGQAAPSPDEDVPSAEPEPEPGQEGPAPGGGYAVSVSSESVQVENPELAIGPPDGRFAEISISGVLDLAINVTNSPGPDLAVYARPPARQLPQAEGEDQLEFDQAAMWWGQFAYAVLGLDAGGEWIEIGMGSGRNPDSFELGALKSTKRVLIMFKVYTNPYNQGPKPMRLGDQELTFGVDAVRAMH